MVLSLATMIENKIEMTKSQIKWRGLEWSQKIKSILTKIPYKLTWSQMTMTEN